MGLWIRQDRLFDRIFWTAQRKERTEKLHLYFVPHGKLMFLVFRSGSGDYEFSTALETILVLYIEVE
jgi:hypothetical protein